MDETKSPLSESKCDKRSVTRSMVFDDDIDGWMSRKPKDETKKITDVVHGKSRIDRDSEVYDMNHKRRGVAIIFNHIHFKKLATRNNADKDSSELASTLRNLGFEVRVYIDPNLKTISSVLQTTSAEDHTDADCLVVAAMSHGESGFLFSADSVYSADSLWTPFTANRCPTLAGKPKLFFIQACRGTQTDNGVEIRQETDSATAYTIPSFADILVAYSTYDGFYSMRNSETGSWFIQALCRELNKNGKTHDLLRIMTSVIRHVAIDYQSYAPYTPNIHGKKQVPSIVSMLTRLVYFSKDEMDDALKTARRSRLSLDF